MILTNAMLTGQSDAHLARFPTSNHRLQVAALDAFLAMQEQAKKAGFNLQPASTFRDFQRQQMIWNEKFAGIRPVLDHNSQPLEITHLTTEQLCHAILHWSALPGASRHHWGTDLDIYDPDLLPEETKLQLEPWEYQQDGYFCPLTEWLSDNMAEYGFYRPFVSSSSAVAEEPWHLSYQPLAQHYENQLTPALLLDVWQEHIIAGYSWLKPHLDEIFQRYIKSSTAK